jgi:hypothetical protein
LWFAFVVVQLYDLILYIATHLQHVSPAAADALLCMQVLLLVLAVVALITQPLAQL